MVLRGGVGSSALPAHRSFVVGGHGTLPGVRHRSVGGRRHAVADVSWMRGAVIPTPPVPFARRITLPSRVGVFVAAGMAGGDIPDVPWRADGRVHPVVGVRVDLWGPMARIEVGADLRSGRMAITFDAHPDWWPIL